MIPGVLASAETAYLLPFAPTLNSLTIVNSGKVTATFTPAATGRVPSFFVLKAASSSGTLTISGAASPLTLSGAYAPNTLYAFSVGANNVYGTTYSTSSGTIPYVYIQSPGAPTNVTVTGTTNSVIVNWTAPVISGTPLSYYIKDTNQIISGTVSVPTTTITLGYGTGGASFPANSGYSMQVQSVNNSPYNGGVSAFVTGTPSPFVPNPVVVTPTIGTATRISNTQVSVAFTPPSTGPTPSSYTVRNTSTLATQNGASSPITITETYTQGTAYTFQVLSNGTGGPSAYSSASNSVTPYPYVAPVAPSAPTLSAGDYNFANIAWTWSQSTGGPVTSFSISDSLGNSTTAAANATSVTLSTNVAYYVYNTSYNFTVTAIGPGGSTSSAAASLKPNTTPPPGSVTGVGISNGSATGVTVSWTAPSTGGAVTYYLVTDGASSSNTTTNTSYTWTGESYTAGNPYTFTVTPYNNSGAGTPGSTTAVVWTPPSFTVWYDAVGCGGGGSWYGGGGGGGVTSSTGTATTGTVVSMSVGAVGTGTGSALSTGGTGGTVTCGPITAFGGNGGGPANSSSSPTNRGNGGTSGSPTNHAGAGGTSSRGGGGGGASGSPSGANGANGIALGSPIGSQAFGAYQGGGGGALITGGTYGTSGQSNYGTGGQAEFSGLTGFSLVTWLTSAYPGTPTASPTGIITFGSYGSYSYAYIVGNNSASITF